MLRLKNTLHGQLEEFRSVEPGRVRMYHCGPTVNEPINISKFRSYLLADVLRRTLEAEEYKIVQVMNITDVGHLNEFEEDIIEIAAARTGLHAWELIEKEEKIFQDDRRAVHIREAHHYPRAREHIEDMIAFIQDLETKGCAYKAGNNLYFDITRAPRLGELSGKSVEELQKLLDASRTPAHPEKRRPLDIDLWRTDVEHQRHWPSPWGRGYPGWHVECVAMGRRYLGESFDIHTGAHDNLFPHHECEIAQAEALSGQPLAKYWLHSGQVHVDGEVMSLRNRNVVTVRELLAAGFRGSVIRVALLSRHYREILPFREACLEEAREKVDAFLSFYEYLADEAKSSNRQNGDADLPWITETDATFQAAIENDLDYPTALQAVVDVIDRLEPAEVGDPSSARDAVERWDEVLGILRI